jgi:hypothetical protein
MAFKDLRKNSLASLTAEIEKLADRNQSFNNNDDKLWRPVLDKSSNGFAVLRFMDAPEGEDLPWVRIWDHGFKGPSGKWYIENSLSTLNQKDPLGEYNSKLWNSGVESDKEIARKQKRRLNYYSNVYIESDPQNPENEGKVFLFRYGKKIFDKLSEAMEPQFEDETPINPFDLWKGASFKLKIRMVEGYWNYDKSMFSEPSQFKASDDEMESIWKQCHSLAELVAPDKFKSYDELQAKLNDVLGTTMPETPTSQPQVQESIPEQKEPVVESGDAMSYFEKLANS